MCDFVSRLSEFCRYNAVFGTAMEQEDVKDTKLEDDEMSQLVLETDVELEDNPGCLKMGRIAHVSQQLLAFSTLISLIIVLIFSWSLKLVPACFRHETNYGHSLHSDN